MPKERKIKLSVLFISGISIILLTLTLVLSYVSLDSANRLGKYAIDADKKNIKDTTTLLFLEITNRTAEAYSSYFDDISKFTLMLTNQIMVTPENYDLKDELNEIKLIEYKDKGFFVESHFNDRKAVLYWGSKEQLQDVENKINKISKWFFPYVNALMELNRTYFYSVWLVSVKDKFMIFDTFQFLNAGLETGFYEKINKRDNIEDYINKNYLNSSDELVLPIWHKPHKGIAGKKFLDVFFRTDNDRENKNYITGIDIRLNRLLNAMSKASMISEKKAALSKEWKSIYNKMDGFTFIMDNQANIILFPKNEMSDFNLDNSKSENLNLKDSKSSSVRRLAEKMIFENSGVMTINVKGINYIVAFSTIRSTDWVLGFVTHEKALMSAAMKTERKLVKTGYDMRVRFIIAALIFLSITVFISIIFFKKFLFKPIDKIRREIRKMGKGRFDIDLTPEGTEEIAELATAFNYLGHELNEYMENLKKEVAARQAVETEIEIAGKMQKTILPKPNMFKNEKGFQIYSKLVPAKDVSGDFYDYFYLDKENIVFLVADVSGKGLQAAFFMAMSKVLINNISKKIDDPAEVLEHVNNSLSSDNEASMFVTVFLSFYNIKTGRLRYVNAGHHGAILIKKDGCYNKFGEESKNIAIGFLPDNKFSSGTIDIGINDTVVLFTDGIVEAVSRDNIEYGEEKLRNTLLDCYDNELDIIADRIVNDVHEFEEPGNQFDDITILLFRRLKIER